jgi:hypothetical protein
VLKILNVIKILIGPKRYSRQLTNNITHKVVYGHINVILNIIYDTIKAFNPHFRGGKLNANNNK